PTVNVMSSPLFGFRVAAECAWRHAVIARRISNGPDRESGSRFVERMLTVVATCRWRSCDVREDLLSCFEADQRYQRDPIPPAGDGTDDQSRSIPAIPSCERLRCALESAGSVVPSDEVEKSLATGR